MCRLAVHFHAGVSLGSSVEKRLRVVAVHRRDVGAFEHRKQQAQVRRFDDEVVGEECQARGAVHVHVEMRAAGPA